MKRNHGAILEHVFSLLVIALRIFDDRPRSESTNRVSSNTVIFRPRAYHTMLSELRGCPDRRLEEWIWFSGQATSRSECAWWPQPQR